MGHALTGGLEAYWLGCFWFWELHRSNKCCHLSTETLGSELGDCVVACDCGPLFLGAAAPGLPLTSAQVTADWSAAGLQILKSSQPLLKLHFKQINQYLRFIKPLW